MNYFAVPGFKRYQNGYGIQYMQMQRILEAICSHFNYSDTDVLGRSRRGNRPIARQLFFYISHFNFRIGCVKSSKFLGKDHTSAVHGCKRIKDLISIKDGIVDDLNDINHKLNSISIAFKNQN